jgi:radical SAM protein with 4Fe4S-binding SPASM domain
MSRFAHPQKTLYVQMDITKRCNLHCIMCVRKQNRGQGADLPVEDLTVIARKLFDKAAVLCLSCGAEPLMSSYFEQIMDVVGQYNIPQVKLITNGNLLDERRERAIIESGVTTLEVSIDAAEKATYERIRRGGRFDVLIGNLRRLNALKAEYRTRHPLLKLNFVMMQSNIRELPAFIDLARDLGAVQVNPQHLVAFQKADLAHESLYHSQELADAMLAEARRRARRRGIVLEPVPPFKETRGIGEQLLDQALYAINAFRAYGLSHGLGLAYKYARRKLAIGRAACYLPWEFVLVSPQGSVKPCGWWSGQPPMGNLYEQSFEEIWQGEDYAALRQQLKGQCGLGSACTRCPAVASRRVDESAFQPLGA